MAAVEGVSICVRLIVLVVGGNLVSHLVGDFVRPRDLLVLPPLQVQDSSFIEVILGQPRALQRYCSQQVQGWQHEVANLTV